MTIVVSVFVGIIGFVVGGDWLHYSLLLLAAVVGWRALRSP